MRVLRGNSVASGSVGKGGGRSNVMNNRFQEDAMHQEGAQDLQQRNEELVLVNERLVVDQRELLRQQRLVVLGKLVATIAHKIGTPLTAISGHLQLLLEDPQLSSEVNQRIQIIFRQTDRLNTVMQDLLNFVRTPTLALESVSIPHCLDQALQLFLPIFDKQSILLSTHYHASLPLACGDFLQLQDAVNNLIDNAIDAMPHGGQLRVSAWPQDRQDSVVHEPGICIEIHDTGIGIPSDCLESIFQTFFTTKNIGEGTGLGLAIASEIVQQHQGQLSVESTEGKGTTFSLWLPAWSEKV
ncbi:MAG: ATP-binding protein [Nitrospirota bacterium]|nr:ATP-binding protein [Nitrospirota bacterium]